jgi:dienelactone hydrolase
MKYFLLFFTMILSGYTFSQVNTSNVLKLAAPVEESNVKEVIQTADIHHWVHLDYDRHLAISKNGQYITYRISNRPLDGHTLIVQSLDGSWKEEFQEGTKVSFSDDSKLFVFSRQDSLFFVKLGQGLIRTVGSVNSFKVPLLIDQTKGEWLAYQLKGASKDLVLYNLISGAEKQYNSVMDYSFDDHGNVLLLQTSRKEELATLQCLIWVGLPDGEGKEVFATKEENINGIDIDGVGKQLAFMVRNKNALSQYNIWYYKVGMPKAILKVDNNTSGIDSGLVLQPSPRFSEDGRYLYFNLHKQETRKGKPGMPQLDVWNYKDTVLQSWQLLNSKTSYYSMNQTYTAAVQVDDCSNSKNCRVVRITKDYDILWAVPKKTGNHCVIVNKTRGDRFWLNLQDSNWLVSLKDGSRVFLTVGSNIEFKFSPSGHFLVYYDKYKGGDYFCFNISTGKISNISEGIPKGTLEYIDEYKNSSKRTSFVTVGSAGWVSENDGILVYDNFDLWLLDLNGKKAPMNITKSYGVKHRIKFRLANQFNGEKVYSHNSKLLLTAYDMETKFNGFFQVSPNAKSELQELCMKPYTFYHSDQKILGLQEFETNMEPLKASDVNVWIVKRHTYNEAPNYFSTTNFKDFKALTDLNPQANYNWLSAELIKWKQLDGTNGQGILYKPENFNPNKKYPLLIYYYRQFSYRLYEYPRVEFTGDAHINVPWFVSRGYLVFIPDIYFKEGERNGECAFNAIVSGAKFLSHQSYIDSTKIGISGHSFAGGLTNYLITKTNLFAAAFEGAGTSDRISSGLQLSLDDGNSRLSITEEGFNFWERPDLYIESSPIMNAHKINTPLLIFHCKKDDAMPFEQGVELFIALRRLNKKAWLLQYDKGTHAVFGSSAEDLTIRVTQFYDYYLKGAQPPVWMTRGIPARLKGIEDGLELDLSGCKP